MVVTKDKVDDHLHDTNKEDKDDGSEELTDIGTNGSKLEG